jgi:allantoin racemase
MARARVAVLLPVRELDESIASIYREVLKPYAQGVDVDVVWVSEGPSRVETAYDDLVAGLAVAKEAVRLWKEGYQGILVNCFDDPGVEAARELVPIPVIGAGLASYLLASAIADRFGVITVGDERSVEAVRLRARLYRVEDRIVDITAVNVHPDEIHVKKDDVLSALEDATRKLIGKGVHVVVLGCTSFTLIADDVRRTLKGYDVVVIDPTIAGFLVLRSMVEAGLRNPYFSATR